VTPLLFMGKVLPKNVKRHVSEARTTLQNNPFEGIQFRTNSDISLVFMSGVWFSGIITTPATKTIRMSELARN
jgi:hypothetical protein